jgi:hypothetical protein
MVHPLLYGSAISLERRPYSYLSATHRDGHSAHTDPDNRWYSGQRQRNFGAGLERPGMDHILPIKESPMARLNTLTYRFDRYQSHQQYTHYGSEVKKRFRELAPFGFFR